jgi:hypothetical protein
VFPSPLPSTRALCGGSGALSTIRRIGDRRREGRSSSALSFQKKTEDTPSTFACFTFSGRRFAYSNQGGRQAHQGAMGLQRAMSTRTPMRTPHESHPPATVLADIPAPSSRHHPFVIMKLPKADDDDPLHLFSSAPLLISPHDSLRLRSASLLVVFFLPATVDEMSMIP